MSAPIRIAPQVLACDLTRLVAGTSIFHAPDYAEAIGRRPYTAVGTD